LHTNNELIHHMQRCGGVPEVTRSHAIKGQSAVHPSPWHDSRSVELSW